MDNADQNCQRGKTENSGEKGHDGNEACRRGENGNHERSSCAYGLHGHEYRA